MRARTELEAIELEAGAAIVLLKTRYPEMTWGRVAQAVGVKRAEAKELAVRYLLQSAADGGAAPVVPIAARSTTASDPKRT